MRISREISHTCVLERTHLAVRCDLDLQPRHHILDCITDLQDRLLKWRVRVPEHPPDLVVRLFGLPEWPHGILQHGFDISLWHLVAKQLLEDIVQLCPLRGQLSVEALELRFAPVAHELDVGLDSTDEKGYRPQDNAGDLEAGHSVWSPWSSAVGEGP